MPRVSVILPSFNRTRFLTLAIDSVFAQTYADWEIIVADDGSGEETRGYLKSLDDPRVRILWLPHCGNPSQVRNAALAAAGGRYVAFLDSDDQWAPAKLEKQLAALQGSGARWSYTAANRIDERGRTIPSERLVAATLLDGSIFEPLLTLQLSIPMPTLMAERSLVDAAGRFDEEQRYGEFHDLMLRLALNADVVAVREPLCFLRTHDEHYSADRIAAFQSWRRLYDKMAALAPTPRLRRACLRMRAAFSVRLARQQAAEGDHAAARATLGRDVSFGYRFPRWWWGALGVLTRMARKPA